MANLKDLIAALGEVADAYHPDPNDDDDATEKDPLDDPYNDDDGNPDDDPRGYHDDDEDEDDGFSRPRIFSTVMLLQRLDKEAEEKQLQRLSAAPRNQRLKQPSNAEKNSEKLLQLRMKTAAVESELRTRKQIALQEERLEQARLELYKAIRTKQQRQEQESDMQQIALHYSPAYPDLHPEWRSRAQETFNKRILS